MLYPFMTLEDDTEIVHSDMDDQGRVRVEIEKPDAILQSICPVDPEVESRWLSVVRRRRAEYRAGRVKTVSSDEVFAEAFKRVSV